jgi:hypothetical protein
VKPPLCCICGRQDDPGASLVSFADFEPLPPGMVGHPAGLEWVCSAREKQARSLRHLPSGVAIAKARGGGVWSAMLARLLRR